MYGNELQQAPRIGAEIQSACTPRQPEVYGWLDSLDGASTRLIELAATLENRLSVVSGAEPPSECEAKQSQAYCDVAVRIQRAVIGLAEADRRISSILRRLEV